MKYKNSLILNLVLVYLAYLLFYGIIIKFTIWNDIIFEVKTYIPEVILGIIVVLVLLKYKIKTTYKGLILIGYLAVVVLLNYIIHGATIESFYWWRDLIIPFVAALIISNISFSKGEMNNFFEKLILIAKWFLILGLGLAIIQQLMGDGWSSKFYTGYIFYGQDPYSKVKIAHNMGLLRAPSLTGNFSTFAYYSCFCLFVIINNSKDKGNTIFWTLITLSNCLLSTNKSAIVVLLAVLFIKYTYNIRKKNRNLNFLFGFLILFSLLILIALNFESLSSVTNSYTGGFLQRFGIWKQILETINPFELVIPFNMFLYGSGGTVEFGFFDSLYLYGLVTQGVFGLLLWISYIRELYIGNAKKNLKIKKLSKDMLYFLLLVGITSNVVQGHAYFCIFLIMFAIFFNFGNKKKNNEVD